MKSNIQEYFRNGLVTTNACNLDNTSVDITTMFGISKEHVQIPSDNPLESVSQARKVLLSISKK